MVLLNKTVKIHNALYKLIILRKSELWDKNFLKNYITFIQGFI